MGGLFSIFKSKKKGNNDGAVRQGNAQWGVRQPAGNQGFLNDAVILPDPRHPVDETESRVVSNEMQNILSGDYDSSDHGVKPDVDWMPSRRRGFDDKLSKMSKEELRNLYLKVKNEGEEVLDNRELSYGTPRAYDFTEKEVDADEFNPGHDDELQKVLKEIDSARSMVAAYKALMKYAGNEDARLLKSDAKTDWDADGVLSWRFKARLKLMARMIRDYPELVGRIGNMQEIARDDKENEDTIMWTTGAVGRQDARLGYNPKYDETGPEGEHVRESGTDSTSYAGTHEFGHILESLLIEHSSEEKDVWRNQIISAKILQEVLNKDDVMSPKQRRKLVYHKKTRKNHVAGQINTSSSKLDKKGITTDYGATNAQETFAEAFSDVYQYGKNARKASIEIVKNYERKAKMKVIIGLLRKKDSSWLLQQENPEKFGYSAAEEQYRLGVNKTYDSNYKNNSPDLNPRVHELSPKFNDAEYEKLNKWDDDASEKMDKMRSIPNGKDYGSFDMAERDILRVKNIASSLITYGIPLPPLPRFDSRGIKPKEFLTFLILSKERQKKAIAEMDSKKAGNAGPVVEQKVGGEPVVAIKDPDKEEVKQPEGNAKNGNIINKNPSSGNNMRPSGGKKPQLAPIINVNGPNSKISVINPPVNVGQPAERPRKWYNKTELLVMEQVERINNGERVHLKLSELAESRLRSSILAKVREAQRKMGDIE